MNKSIEALLAECEDLISRNEVSRAHGTILELIRCGSRQDLERLRTTLLEIIGRFLPKRKRELTLALEDRLAAQGARQSVPRTQSLRPIGINQNRGLREYEISVAARFDDLSRYHIFQWSTYYRDALREVLEDTVHLVQSQEGHDEAFDLLTRQVRRHSREIFSKGYSFVSGQSWATVDVAEGKSLGGLRCFIDLPVELYADESSRLTAPQHCRVLRRATSRTLVGILLGFSDASFGQSSPPSLLRRTVKSWAHILPLLEECDLKAIDAVLDLKDLSPLLGEPLFTLTRALDEASRMSSVDPVVVVSATMNLGDHVIDLTLRPPADSSDTKPLEVAILAGDSTSIRHQVDQRVKLGYIACVTPKSATTYSGGKFVPSSVSGVVVPIHEARAGFLLERMRQRFYENQIVIPHGAPLKTNIAERFPLENPTLLTFFRVQRQSIRALETMLSTRTGVLLWCSVRRSGKTTGVSELASAVQEKSAVFQRCEMTGLDRGSRAFFEAVCDALNDAAPLSRDFVRKLVAQAAPMGVAPSRGSILILDEYDRLFGRLRAAGRRNEDVRHLVVQPLLDQLVEFATENLLILLGQQPNAHYIFMDQNQLSAYVQQEPYPLFSHTIGATYGEFWELLGKVFQQTLRYDASFADAVYTETGGHPFLTVNVLRELVDWLIEKRAVPSGIMLTRSMFVDFATDRLGPREVGMSRHFDYFREAAAEALSVDGAAETPWIHAAYDLLRLLGASGKGGRLSLARANVEGVLGAVLKRVGLANFTTESFIASASRGNFVDVDGDLIAAKIPILARVAAAARH